MSPMFGISIVILMLLQCISSQRPIVNSSTSATSSLSSASLFNAYEALSPSIAPAVPPPSQQQQQQPQIPQTRSDIAKLRFKPAPNNSTGRTAFNDRIGKFMELKESVKNATIYSPNGLSNFPHDGYYRRGTPLDKLKKMVKENSYNNIHNKTNPSQGDDSLPYSIYLNKNDPIKKVKNAFQKTINYQPQSDVSEWDYTLGVACYFEKPCMWTYDTTIENGFQVVSGVNLTASNRTGMMPGPSVDGQNDAAGHFLHLRVTQDTPPLSLTSPVFSTTRENCYLEVLFHESEMSHGSIKIVIVPEDSPHSSWVPAEIAGDNLNKWQMNTFKIGKVSKDFHIELEVFPNGKNWTDGQTRGHISIDNLRLVHCFPEGAVTGKCNPQQVRCTSRKLPVCIRLDRVCDIDVDCDEREDEELNCDKMPFGSRCDFENGWCGWQNTGKAMMEWSRHSGPTPTEKTGPNSDHTFNHNETADGHFLYVNMNQHANDTEKQKSVGFASNAVINSQIFNPPPRVHSNSSSMYRNSCMVRFYVHQFGFNAGSINLSIVEMKDKENITTTLWWSTKNMGENWHRAEQILPNVTSRYYFQFEARMGMRIFSDVAIDDFSLSPECFGLNIPEEELNGYNYWDPHFFKYKEPHKDFEEIKYYELGTCGAKGRYGPTPDACRKAYNATDVEVAVSTKPPFNGTQRWKVPNEGYYTIIVKGAGGGLGSAGVGSSRGASVMSVMELHKNEEIHVLIGQSGEHACIKSLGQREAACEEKYQSHNKNKSKVSQVREMNIEDGAGGGGGASYVFLFNSAKNAVPLLIAAGGGGLGIGRFNDDFQHGRGEEVEDEHRTGNIISMDDKAAGPGGGWQDGDETLLNTTGLSLLSGAIGGVACYQRGVHGFGGFGGGGGGCSKGGGGGGYTGGDTMFNSSNGQGGTSYLSSSRKHHIWFNIESAANSGSGSVIIIPAIEGCGCDYRCVALDEYRANVSCICPQGWQLSPYNQTSCEIIEIPHNPSSMTRYIIVLIFVASILVLALTALIFMLYNRYQRKKQAELRHKMLLEQDLQLSRLRNTPDSITSPSVNIDYGCDGILNNGNVDVKSLPQVARESLRLVKALGQGAFGEVYQGLYRHRDGDAVEMPVAVKTLPEMSTGQAESDFLMEAAIMAKFNHPNIVHLIGVCFDRHPRFIVLELLAGGDLKNFLREGRNKPERPSPLTMKDLVFCALDVAKGCRYLESKRFIHRDIAARNCLLSSKGPGRVVKIADFGMARDIYRSDYYRKGGKAMLPIKWMPPEAFLDGIFTSKTDVWSFGVLLWEVFSLGLMPYTGLPNRDVMQLVTGGGRLDAPLGCPMAIYRVMADCWNPTPELRPSFSNLLDRLTACSQDAEIMNAALPSFFRPQSNERDTTIMRPPGHDDFCLQVPNSDYLIPLSGPRSAVERLLTEATGVTLPDTMTTMSAPKNTKSWETSFSMANGKPLTQSLNSNDKMLQKESSTEKLISLDTPQQTPTSVQPPPMNFTPLSALNNNDVDASTINSIQSQQQQQQPITLDPAMLNKQTTTTTNTVNGGTPYANVKMMNANNLSELQDKLCSNNTANNKQTPFTIQGFNDRYNIAPNENHSEISC